MASGVDSTIRISFGIVHGLLLAIVLPLAFVIAPVFAKSYPLLLLLTVLPTISYLWGLGLNSLSQYITCSTVSMPQVALVSLISPLFVIVFSLLAYFIPFLRSPVEEVLPYSADADMKYAIGFGFYMLWAGIYGQNVSSGMVQSCPGAAGPK
jgi:hypothetical protein